MSNAAAEAENPQVMQPEGLVPVPSAGASLIDRWVEGDPEKAIERVNTRVRMLEALRVASIRATYPTDWVVHVTKDENGNVLREVCYLQDAGADRAAKVWGIEVGNPAIEREDFPTDNTFAYHMVAEAWSKVTGERLDFVEGSRWSGDPFFQRQVKKEGDRLDPIDVRKAAYTNLHGRAVRALSGLNGVPLEMLRSAGLDVAKAVHIAYGSGTSGASVGSAELVMAWGNSKGKKVTELEDKDLAWYAKAYEKDLADPSKAKWQKNNQRMLDALKAEQERRAKAADQAAETGTQATADVATRGKRLTALHARLKSVFGAGNMKHIVPFLSSATRRAIEAASDLTDDEIAGIMEIDEAKLKAEVADFIAAAGSN